jgi:hypothetical protein
MVWVRRLFVSSAASCIGVGKRRQADRRKLWCGCWMPLLICGRRANQMSFGVLSDALDNGVVGVAGLGEESRWQGEWTLTA